MYRQSQAYLGIVRSLYLSMNIIMYRPLPMYLGSVLFYWSKYSQLPTYLGTVLFYWSMNLCSFSCRRTLGTYLGTVLSVNEIIYSQLLTYLGAVPFFCSIFTLQSLYCRVPGSPVMNM